jgi:hypothetical protein
MHPSPSVVGIGLDRRRATLQILTWLAISHGDGHSLQQGLQLGILRWQMYQRLLQCKPRNQNHSKVSVAEISEELSYKHHTHLISTNRTRYNVILSMTRLPSIQYTHTRTCLGKNPLVLPTVNWGVVLSTFISSNNWNVELDRLTLLTPCAHRWPTRATLFDNILNLF